MFECLPEEILLRVLGELDIRDILRCSLVCRCLHTLVSNSTVIQYKIELGIAGFVDGDPTSNLSTVSDRLRSLKTFEHNWSCLNFRKVTQHEMPGIFDVYAHMGWIVAFEFTDGDRPFSDIRFTELPSFANGFLKKQWEHVDIGVNIQQFELDPSQDLLVLIDGPTIDGNNYLVRIHIRSLTTGLPHLESHSPILSCNVSRLRHGGTRVCSIRIMGPYVALMTDPPTRTSLWTWISPDICHLYIWNWKTGALTALLELPCHETRMESFFFLSLRHILISQNHRPLREGTSSSLAVYEIPDEMLTLKLLRTYRLPTVKPGVIIVSMPIGGEALGYTNNRSMFPWWPFLTDPRSILLTVKMDMLDTVRRAVSRTIIFLHASTLMNHSSPANVPHDDTEIPWQLWIPHNTRIFEHFGDYTVWGHDTCGQRYVRFGSFLQPPETSGVQEGGDFGFLWVYDFNPLSLRKAQSSVAKEDPIYTSHSSRQWIFDDSRPTMVPANISLFNEEVRTRLPYRVTRSATQYEFYGVMIYPDGIIGEMEEGSIFDGQQLDEDGLLFLSI